jgi:hypothetical protein
MSAPITHQNTQSTHHTTVTARYLPLLLLLLNACTNGNENASLPDRLPKNRQYTLAEGQPPYIYNSSGIYTGYRLQFIGDSVRMYEPFGRYNQTFRAYEADSTERFADATYLTYTMAADSSLDVVVRDVEDKPFPQRYVLTERLEFVWEFSSLDKSGCWPV